MTERTYVKGEENAKEIEKRILIVTDWLDNHNNHLRTTALGHSWSASPLGISVKITEKL